MTALLDLPILGRHVPPMPPPVSPRVPPRAALSTAPRALAPAVPPVSPISTVPAVGAARSLRATAPARTPAPAATPTPTRTPAARARARQLSARGSVGGCAVHPATWGRTQARTGPAPLRLTRRARLLVSTMTLVASLGLVGLAASQADPGAGRLADAPASVVVQPGDTLWQIAVDVAPGERPAEVVELLRAANGLDGVALQPGQVLSIPRG